VYEHRDYPDGIMGRPVRCPAATRDPDEASVPRLRAGHWDVARACVQVKTLNRGSERDGVRALGCWATTNGADRAPAHKMRTGTGSTGR